MRSLRSGSLVRVRGHCEMFQEWDDKSHFFSPHVGWLRARALPAPPPKFPRTCKIKRFRRLGGASLQGWGYREPINFFEG